MAKRISDEAFDALPLSQQLEFVATHLHDIDQGGLRDITNEDIATMLMHTLVMSRKAAALERELQQRRDDERLAVLGLEIAFEQAEAPDSNVVSWPVIARNVHINVHGNHPPKGAA